MGKREGERVEEGGREGGQEDRPAILNGHKLGRNPLGQFTYFLFIHSFNSICHSWKHNVNKVSPLLECSVYWKDIFNNNNNSAGL